MEITKQNMLKRRQSYTWWMPIQSRFFLNEDENSLITLMGILLEKAMGFFFLPASMWLSLVWVYISYWLELHQKHIYDM